MISSRSIRIYLTGQGISMLGTWMQMTAQGWLIWELSHSPRAVGIGAMLGFVPFLFLGPFSGVWADRVDRRKALMVTQALMAGTALLLATSVTWNFARLGLVYAILLFNGCLTAMDIPLHQTFLGDLAGVRKIRKVVVWNNILIQTSRMVGPAVAGFFIGRYGMAAPFWANGVSFLAVILSLTRLEVHVERHVSTEHPWADFKNSLHFVRGESRIQDLIGFTLLLTLFAFSSIHLLPAFVGLRLAGNAEVYGTILAASGAGSLAGAVLLAPQLQRYTPVGRLLTVATLWSGLWFLLLSQATTPLLAGLAIFLASLPIPIVMTTANGVLQLSAPKGMRGRLVSLWLMASFGGQPLGSLLAGLVAQHVGTPTAVALNGVLLMVGALLILWFRQGLWTWEFRSPVPTLDGSGDANL